MSNAIVQNSNNESTVLDRQVKGTTDLTVEATELYADFVAEVVYRSASRDPLAPRNASDIASQEFIKRAGNASIDVLAKNLVPNIMRIPDQKAAQAVCRQYINTAVFWAIGVYNSEQRLAETMAKMGITDNRGEGDARAVFGAYEGSDSPAPIRFELLAVLVDMLYFELAVVYKDATPRQTRQSTAFGSNVDTSILPYATRRHPLTGQYTNFWSLETAIGGLAQMRDLADEVAKLEQKEARKSRGAIDFGDEKEVTADAPAAPAQEAVWD